MKAIIQCKIDDLVLLRENYCDINNLFAAFGLRIICMYESRGIFIIYTEGEWSSIENLTISLKGGEILDEEDFIFRVMDNVSRGKIVDLDLNNYKSMG